MLGTLKLQKNGAFLKKEALLQLRMRLLLVDFPGWPSTSLHLPDFALNALFLRAFSKEWHADGAVFVVDFLREGCGRENRTERQ